MSKQLFALACQDPYLKDCRSTFLADEETCLTLGMVRDVRNFQLDVYFDMIDSFVFVNSCVIVFVSFFCQSRLTTYIHTQAQTS